MNNRIVKIQVKNKMIIIKRNNFMIALEKITLKINTKVRKILTKTIHFINRIKILLKMEIMYYYLIILKMKKKKIK